jgi:hypothetical protein
MLVSSLPNVYGLTVSRKTIRHYRTKRPCALFFIGLSASHACDCQARWNHFHSALKSCTSFGRLLAVHCPIIGHTTIRTSRKNINNIKNIEFEFTDLAVWLLAMHDYQAIMYRWPQRVDHHTLFASVGNVSSLMAVPKTIRRDRTKNRLVLFVIRLSHSHASDSHRRT